MYNAIIIGGGTSGLACACFCNKDTLVLDKQRIGKKLSVAGNSRVNLTNLADLDDFIKAYIPNGNFLRDAFGVFFREELIDFVSKLGLKTQIENTKVFLSNSNGEEFVKRIKNYIIGRKAQIHEYERVTKIEQNKHFFVHTTKSIYEAKNIVIATGGLSYPKLGACADGYNFAKSFGHNIAPTQPFETPFCIKDDLFKNLDGISLDNVEIKYKNKIFSGNLLFTHFGLSGPTILDLSCYTKNGDKIYINFLGNDKEHLLKDLNDENKNLKSIIKKYLPKRFAENMSEKIPFIKKKILEVSKKDLNLLLNLIFNYKVTVELCGFERAFVTKGGVSLREVDPKSCASKLVKGLYFCGEVLDIAGTIGGFNIQAAFSTGYLVSQKLGSLPLKNI
ncbi:NAD(FAD)-utilizing dehydrogenase [Desulfurella amilsii]|uniref:NAD(FAD)-utilizing dehydrogenase n=1 Tax=Desulfurella amilsii TaxID=1562698 RepID=A0A1X4XYZ1_9BACT|nr:aminoacetone oxidase family FAD-binding enzyme [Desulfurella amilsii]OSS42757.1 NAD(FAD)-utilizing dehydrogenase [Desulfurella amilsii]OSS42833.1 NAD(FAD)-utilizing dehydrogenase [Desulfurella amilsii]